MIIHKDTLSVETLTGFPNENFGNYENVFVVADDSELGEKIESYKPYFQVVLNDGGELIDITPTERPPEPPQPPTPEERLSAIEDLLITLI